MMKPRIKKASVALTLVASLLFNGLSFTCIQSVEAAKTSAIETEYDPFAEEEEVKVQKEQNNEKLTFKERLALSQKEKSPNTITIDNVLPGHVYIPKKTKLKVELVEAANSKTHKPNQEVEIKLLENLIINGVLIIPKGPYPNFLTETKTHLPER